MDPAYQLALTQAPPGTLAWLLHFDRQPKVYENYLSSLSKPDRTSSAKQIYPKPSLTDPKLRAHLMMAKHKKFLEQDPEGWRKHETERIKLCNAVKKEEVDGRVEEAVKGRGDRMWVRIVMELQLVEERNATEKENKSGGGMK